ncbi:MAG: protein kinase, partial [Micrococcaceae bacterium]|nr:protein kinase [Micrococcaceae bacterium]
MESDEEPLTFPQIKGYRAVRHLDDGSGSSVWVVENVATHEELALKIPGGATDRETGIAESLQVRHEFLVEAVGRLETSLGQGILMEYCPAGSAAQVVAVRGPLSVGETITVIAPIAGALAFLHGQGMTHGDLSPRNILFTAEGKPKLGDFGTHREVGQVPGSHGTQGFCAPETGDLPEALELEPARDVYALAACAWYLLTGRAPNATANRVPLGSMVPDVNDEFARLLEQALDLDPGNRPSAEQFGQRIFVAGEAVPVELSGAIEHDALKHMLTTRQAPAGGQPRAGYRRRGNPTAADKELLKQRRAQINAQEKPAPRRLRVDSKDRRNAPTESRERVVGAQGVGEHRIRRLKCGNRRVVAGLVAGVLLVGSAAAGAILSGPTPEPAIEGVAGSQKEAATTERSADLKPAPGVAGQPPSDLERLVDGLVASRDRVLMSGNPSDLENFHAAGSPALAVDKTVMAKMKGLGVRLEGLATKLSAVKVIPGHQMRQATFEADSSQSSYRYVDVEGRTVVSIAEPATERVRMTLRYDDGHW